MAEDIRKLHKAMEKALDPKRYEHTLGVEYTCASLAMRYGESIEKAQLAGLLHDCAKCIPDEKKISLCEKYNVPLSKYEKSNPGLIHAKLGSVLARELYGVEDEEVLSAIAYHTTGHPDMTLLEKIVYIGDYIEPGRKPLPDLDEIRLLAFKDIDQALIQVLSGTLEYLSIKGIAVDPATKETYDYYCENV